MIGSRFRFLLLPAFGAFAGVLAFKVAAPFESTLNRPGMSLLDPEAQFTFGTRWGDVNRAVFGALIVGLFSFGLTYGRRSWMRAIGCTIFGAILGAIFNFVTDSGSDVIGLSISRHAGILGNIVASVAWCVLVPAGISFAILLAIGPTTQRISRAFAGTVVAAVASYIAQMVGTMFGGHHLAQSLATSLASNMAGAGGGASLEAFIPVWRAQEIAVGIALGLAMAYADSSVRVGTLRLVVGRNEWREWSLDHTVNRVGSDEGLEIPLGRIQGVEKLHALIVKQGARFILDTQGNTVLLNGQPASQNDLKHSDTIQMGHATLQFLSGSVVTAGDYRPTPGIRGAVAPHGGVPMTTALSSQPIAPVAMGVLIDAAGGQYHLPPGQYGVGREQDNAICLSKESSVSRYHAKLVVTPAGTQLADMGSTNGTLVNGAKVVGETLLRPGDKLQFGCVQFTVGTASGQPTPVS